MVAAEPNKEIGAEPDPEFADLNHPRETRPRPSSILRPKGCEAASHEVERGPWEYRSKHEPRATMLIPPTATVELSTYREHRDYLDRLVATTFGVPREILVGEVNYSRAATLYPRACYEQPKEETGLATIPGPRG